MNIRKIIFYLWICFVVLALTSYFFFPEIFVLESVNEFIEEYYIESLIIYFIILSLRGLTLIPSTPLLFSGILLFDPIPLFLVNMAGILTSSTIVYYFTHYMGFDIYVEKRYGKYVHIIKEKLKHKELPVITAWGFFPFVPTDVIVYAASTLRIKLWKCLLGVFIGEAVLNSFYIFSFSRLFR